MTAAMALAAAVLVGGCTGGSESNAAEEPAVGENGAETKVNPRETLGAINPAIPIYQGAKYHEDLTRRDEVMIRNRYGNAAEVYTLATNDSFPQVYHYYTTYLAQFRSFPAQDTYPSDNKNWRTLEVTLNEAMQDPFIPGAALEANKQIILQVAETEAQPKTVIRYIVTPAPPPQPAVAEAAAVAKENPAPGVAP